MLVDPRSRTDRHDHAAGVAAVALAVLLAALAITSWQSSVDAAERHTRVGNRIAVSMGDEPTYAEQPDPAVPLFEGLAAEAALAFGVVRIGRSHRRARSAFGAARTPE